MIRHLGLRQKPGNAPPLRADCITASMKPAPTAPAFHLVVSLSTT
jgi:hypothetical protein